MDRPQAAADELATRWKWAEARLGVNWSDLARFGRVHPTPGETTDEEKAECERLHVRHVELVNICEDEWTEELAAEGEAIETRLAEIDAAVDSRAVFRPEDIAISGCIVTVSSEGRMQLVQGLVRPADIPAAEANNDADTAQNSTGNDDAGTAGDGNSSIQAPAISGPAMPPARPDAEAEARKEAGVGIGLADDLRAVRTALVKAHLAEEFGAAFDLMLLQMGRAVFTPGYHDHALDIAVHETPDRPPLRANDDAFGTMSPGDRTWLVNRARQQLWRYYPQLLKVESDLTKAWVRDLWSLALTPDKARRIRARTISGNGVTGRACGLAVSGGFAGALRGSSRDRASVVCRPDMSVIALRDVWPFGASRAPCHPASALPCAPLRMVSRCHVLPSAR